MTVSYFVNYRKQGDATWSPWPSDGSTLNTLSTVVGQNPPGPALAPSQAYEFEVIATNAFGNSTSTISSGTTTTGVAFQSIALNPANPTFTAGFTGTIASVVVTMTSGSFTGNLSVTTGSSNFTIVNGQLQVTNANLAAGPQSFTIQATQSTAANTPYSQGFTVQVGAALAESTEATVVKTVGPTIVASRTMRVPSNGPFNYFQLTSGGQIQFSTNGTTYGVQPATGSVTALLYHKDTLFQLNTGGNWWYWDTATSDALAGTPGYVFYNLTGPVTLSTTSYTANAAPGTFSATISCPMSSNAANDTFPGTWGGTYTLDSGSTATFSITGSTITNKVTLSASSYSPTITAALNVTGSDSTQYAVGHFIATPLSVTQAGVSGGTTATAPSQAVNAGYQNLVWGDDFTTSSSIAPAQYSNSGYSWYWAQRKGLPASPSEWVVNTAATAGSINNGNSGGGPNASSAGGILQINTGGFPNANIITLPGWAMNTFQGTMPPIGTGHWSHCYMEAYIQFKPDQNTAVPYTQTGWPAFWSWDAESIGDYGFGSVNAHAPNATEVDFLESFGYAIWSSGTHNTLSTWDGTIINHGTGATGGLAHGNIDSNWHTYGFLWVPGQVSMYFDNVQTGSHSLSGFSLDSQSLFLTLGTGPNWQMNVDWVRVWQ